MTITSTITIRPATPRDAERLEDLARLDSARPLTGEVLVAEAAGVPVAAVSVADARTVADPFRATAGVVDVLRLRAGQLVSPARRERRRDAHGLRLRAAGG